MSLPVICRSLLAVCVVALAPVPASGQTPATLPLNESASGRVSSQTAAAYLFRASTAGVLSVAVHAESDVTLSVTDVDGQTLPDGMSDRDLFGSGGNEQVMVTLPEAGEYRVVVALLGSGSSSFDLGASWIEMPAFARATDPDRRPGLAADLEVGRSHEDSLAADSGDHWDWFAITPAAAGTLTVILRSVGDDSPDLALELFSADDPGKAIVRSDADLQGNSTNESATIDVRSGDKVYVKVSGVSGNPMGPYRIASSVIE